MKARKGSLLRSAVMALCAALLADGCGGTSRETVLSSDTLKVVAVTESTLDINVSQYRHYTTFVLYVDGVKLSDKAFSDLLQDRDAADDHFVHTEAVVLGEDAILLASRNGDGTRCWTTRFSTRGGKATVEKIIEGSIDCSLRPAPQGWRALYDEASNLILVREQPFQVHPIAGYCYVLWIEGDVVALYREDRDRARLIVRLVRISTDTTLAEQVLPMEKYAEPELLHVSPQVRKQWLFDNFAVSMAPPSSIQLRSDNRLETITAEVWAEYQEIERQNRELDARASAAGEAWREAQRRELMEAEAAEQKAGN